MTTDTPSDLVKRLRALFIMDEANSDNPLGQEAADRIEELEKMLATESEVTLKFSEAIDRLERELAEARDALMTAIHAKEQAENRSRILALDMYGRKP